MNVLFLESIKFRDGVMYNLEHHQMRVDRTLRRFYGTSIDLAVLGTMVPEDKRKGLYKCRVVYGLGIHNVEFMPYAVRKVTSVRLVEDNNIEYGYKYHDRFRLDKLLEESGCDDMIIIKDGTVTDSFAANLVFQSASELYTPENCLLRGTKRQLLLDKGIIKEKIIRAEDIAAYDRVFFINAMLDIEDNAGIDISMIQGILSEDRNGVYGKTNV